MLCDEDTLGDIHTEEQIEQLLAGTNITCAQFEEGGTRANPLYFPDSKTCTVGSDVVPSCSATSVHRRLCPCTAPTVLGPSIADCSQSPCGAGARCVNRKSRDLEDVSTGRPANSSSHAYLGEVFDGDGRFKDGAYKSKDYKDVGFGKQHTLVSVFL